MSSSAMGVGGWMMAAIGARRRKSPLLTSLPLRRNTIDPPGWASHSPSPARTGHIAAPPPEKSKVLRYACALPPRLHTASQRWRHARHQRHHSSAVPAGLLNTPDNMSDSAPVLKIIPRNDEADDDAAPQRERHKGEERGGDPEVMQSQPSDKGLRGS